MMNVPENKRIVAIDIFLKYGGWPKDKGETLARVPRGKTFLFTDTISCLKLNYEVVLTKTLYDLMEPSFKESSEMGVKMLEKLLSKKGGVE